MKKFCNDPAAFVREMMEGLILANPRKLKWIPQYNIVYRADMPRDDKVSVVQGSGSGHEPAHIMFVGQGMLDAACPGNVFAAPPMDSVLECTKLMNSPKGVLHIINNYQGDRMCWDMAREIAEAEGIRVGTLIVDDDVAVRIAPTPPAAAAWPGISSSSRPAAPLPNRARAWNQLVALGKTVNSVTRTMGDCLDFLHAAGQRHADLPNRRGRDGSRRRASTASRAAPRRTAGDRQRRSSMLFEAVAGDLPFAQGDRVGLMINGLGGTPINELYVLYRKAALNCQDRGLAVVRNYVGNYCTSLEMMGASLTLIRLDDELERLLDAPADIALRIF